MPSSLLKNAKTPNRETVGCVLVVDDEAINRVMLGGMLKRSGYESGFVEHGSEVMDQINAGEYDLVLLDIVMPEVDGFEVLTQLREEFSAAELPVIMVTGSDDKKQVVKAFGLGANDFITKPVDVDIAMARIETQMQLRKSQVALRASEERYALAADGTNDGLWDWQIESGDVYFSPRWKSMLGLDVSADLNSINDWLGRIHADDRQRVEQELYAHVQGEICQFEADFRMLRDDESFRWMLCRGAAIRDENGVATRMAGSLTDITEGKVADSLTGLPNRLLFRDRLQRTIDRQHMIPGKFAVLYLDLDNFKLVNDSLGHDAGDQLLIAVARRLEDTVRKSECVVARLGGDEFTVLLDQIPSVSVAEQVAQRIIDAICEPITLESGREIFPTASVGISYVDSTCDRNVDDVLREADTAMYDAKSSGKSQYRLFATEMYQQANQRLEIESELCRALERNEIYLEYQPIVELESGRLTGLEALARWKHPRMGLVSPEDFIPIAEQTGLIMPIGRAVLQMACHQLAEWKERSSACKELSVNVNLSSRQLSCEELFKFVEQTVTQAGLQPRDLQIEITESAIMANLDEGVRLLKGLQNLGVRIGIDDFGKGYSSLHCLHQLPLDFLKIDRSFVNSLTRSQGEVELISTILALASYRRLSVVAEGVETTGQHEELLGMDCKFGQGFFYHRPLTPDRVWHLLNERDL